MIRFLIQSVALTSLLFASAAGAFTYDFQTTTAEGKKRAIWLPASDRGHMLFDEGTTMTIDPGAWKLQGTLTADDGSKWAITIDFGDILSGPQFSLLTSQASGQIATEPVADLEPKKDWGFAGSVQGTLTALDGELAGRVYSLARHPRPADFRAEYGNCPVDVNCDKELSTWIDITDKNTGPIVSVSNPVPEPSAALVFGLGTVLASSSIRRRNR